MRKIFVYPELTEQDDVDNLLSRFAWYFRPFLGDIDSIRISCSDEAMLAAARLAPHLDPAIAPELPALKKKLHFHTSLGLRASISHAVPERDIILIWNVEAEAVATAAVKTKIAELARHGGVYRVDPLRTRQEGSFYLWCGFNKFCNAKALIADNKARFDKMLADIGKHSKAYVFGTGPSFSDFVEAHDFSDGLCIAANSIVKNDAALERLKPQVICAADPIYHAGCSSYAAAFRVSLVKALETTGAWFLCPLRDLAIYQSILPQALQDRMIAIPFDNRADIPVDLAKTYGLFPFPNVLTLMLLPVASTLAENIHIVGCDGRKLLDDSFFWSHDKKVQFNDQMSEIQAAHPGFFNIDYNDYYVDHCLDLERVLCRLEDAGRGIVTETPSLIPALRHRQRGATEPSPAKDLQTLVMLDPDAKDDWGHFLAYDKRVATAARAQGLNFALICREDLDERFRPQEATAFLPGFTVHSWTVGNKTPAVRENILRFATELDDGISRAEAIFDTGDICIFFYVGSLEVAEVLEHLLIDRPRVSAVINLFWSYNFDQNDPVYKERWHAVARRLAVHPRIHLMQSTDQIADEFADDWGIRLPVLEHPSTTFSDEIAKELAEGKISGPQKGGSDRFRVVFPGGARQEKGFLLSLEAADKLRNDPAVAPVLRSRVDKVSGPALRKAYDGLDKSGIEVVDQDLSDAEFIDMIETADVIVVPYHQDAFRRRTSGILVDAMLLGKPVVVLENTWLADVVKAEGIGVCVPATAEGIIAGVRDIVRDYGRFAGKIEKARRAYLDENSWRALVSHVCHLTSGGQIEAGPALAPVQSDKGDLLQRIAASRNASLLFNCCAASILVDAERTLSQIKTDATLRNAIEEALAGTGNADSAKAHFNRVLAFVEARIPESEVAE